MELRKIPGFLKELWHREAGPMNWKNPIRVTAFIGWEIFNGAAFLVGEWVRYGVRAGQIVLEIPPTAILFFGGVWFAVWSFVRRPFPSLETVPLLDLLEYHNPNFYSAVVLWYYLSPLVAVMLAGSIFLSIWKVWIEARKRDLIPFGALPAWPLSLDQPGPEIVIGEVHHPVEPREIFNPEWLTIPERGLYTGIAIFGAVGSGKTSACMHPFAKQLLGWQADDPEKRAAALMLEVKGDFCHDIRSILDNAGRGDDYLEIGMGGLWKWNPLSAWWLDSYSLAYTVASLLNQLFGKGKEPFWQQAYTNLVRWIIELHRVLPEQWVTLQQVYQCAIDPDLFAAKIKQAEKWSAELNTGEVFIPVEKWTERAVEVGEWKWTPTGDGREMRAEWSPELEHKLEELAVQTRIVWEPGAGDDVRERVAAVKRWFDNDWQKLDNKIKSSIVEGVSVFLSMFDMPDVAAVFCPPPPEVSDDPRRIGPKARAAMLAEKKAKVKAQAGEGEDDPQTEGQGEDADPEIAAIRAEDNTEADPQESRQWPADTIAGRTRHLPPLYELIEGGKVLALNMPAGSNPALARAIGVMLKNAWLQALLMRPAQMKESPTAYFRPAVFICDEYQAFASVGEDDPTGDEKSFALTRQCRCIPIVATQSISSLRAVLGSSEAWRALLQTLRTRIFLSLSDDASAKIASELCGQVAKIKGSYTISETSKRAGVSPLSGRAGGSGGGSIGATKSFQERREAVFHPRDFALLGNCQAICLPYDGAQSLEPRRVYLKPHYLPLDHSYWRAKEAGEI